MNVLVTLPREHFIRQKKDIFVTPVLVKATKEKCCLMVLVKESVEWEKRESCYIYKVS